MIFDYKKAIQALNYFTTLQVNSELNILKAMKLLWAADRYHLRQYGLPITLDDYYALPHGPIATNVYDILTRSDFLEDKKLINYSDKFIQRSEEDKRAIVSVSDVDFSFLSETDKTTIVKVNETFKGYGKFKLRDYSHSFPEWIKFKKIIEGGVSNREPMSYLDFFEGKDAFFNQNKELLDLSKKIFVSNYPSHFVKS
jgi:uncharacterized phage-associated protein